MSKHFSKLLSFVLSVALVFAMMPAMGGFSFAAEDATLSATLSEHNIKGISPKSLGTPADDTNVSTAGAVTLRNKDANKTDVAATFKPNKENVTVKVVKYDKSANDFSGFDGADAFKAADAVANGDFFIIKVTDGSTSKYYKIVATVESIKNEAHLQDNPKIKGVAPKEAGVPDATLANVVAGKVELTAAQSALNNGTALAAKDDGYATVTLHRFEKDEHTELTESNLDGDAYKFVDTTVLSSEDKIVAKIVAEDGTTTLYYVFNVTVKSNVATLDSANTKVKGVAVTNLGAPDEALAGAGAGAVTISQEQSQGSAETVFKPTHAGATTKVVKYAKNDVTTDFNTDQEFVNADKIANEDFFIVAVTSEDKTSTNFYKIVVTVESALKKPQTLKFVVGDGANPKDADITKAKEATYGDDISNADTYYAKLTIGDGPISYKSEKNAVATVTNTGKVTINGVGETKIIATAAETAGYEKAEISYILKVEPKKVKIVLKDVAAKYLDKISDVTADFEVKNITDNESGLVGSDNKDDNFKVTYKYADASKKAEDFEVATHEKAVSADVKVETKNYVVESVEAAKLTVNKAEALVTLSDKLTIKKNTSMTYDVAAFCKGIVGGTFTNIEVKNVTDANGVLANGEDAPKKDGNKIVIKANKLPPSPPANAATVTVEIDFKNYEKSTLTLTVEQGAKTVVSLGLASDANKKVYDGKAFDLTGKVVDTSNTGFDTYNFKWYDKSGTTELTENKAPVNAGKYKVEISATKGDVEGKSEKITVEITKKALQLKANNIKVKEGEKIPAVTFTLIGEVAGKGLTKDDTKVTAKFYKGTEEVAEPKEVGEYIIKLTIAPDYADMTSGNNANYEFPVALDGKLTIDKKSSGNGSGSGRKGGGGGSAVTPSKPDDKKKDDSKPAVTVKNEAAKELVKNITDQKQADAVDKLVEKAPVTAKKEAIKALTADTKAKLAQAVLHKYTDVKTNEWYSNDLAVVATLGLVKGTSTKTISPFKNVTGQEMMAMLVRSMGKEVNQSQDANWYDAYKVEAKALKLDEGIKFDLAKDLTRAEVAAMMFRYVKLNEKNPTAIDVNVLAQVKDMMDIPAEYKEAVAYMYQKGLLKGYEDGSFMPNRNVSRIEVAVILARLLAM